MNSFGLGLVLSFTDNATAGMRRASQTFNEMNGIANQMVDASDSAMYSIQTLTATGMSLTILGEQFSRVGQTITGVFQKIISKTNEVGTTILSARTQLSKLYGDEAKGEQVLTNIKEYAKTSIFNFEDLLPSVIMLKANGIEAFDKITTKSGKSQYLMDYAADLAAFNPQMRNMYGTGVQAAMGAINEYIAEGNAKSLKSGASLDITGILGEDKGKTVEERSQQIAELLDKLNMIGMTGGLANTPMQRLSNARDILFDMYNRISDSGVFDKYSQLIAKFTDYLFDISDAEKQILAQGIADALVNIMTPIEKLIDAGIKIIDWVRNLIKEHPKLANVLLTTVAFVGVLLVGAGYALKFSGSLFLLSASLTQMKYLASNGISVLNILGRSFKIVFLKVLPLIAVAGLLYYAWKNNFFGIRDVVTKVMKDLGEVFALTFDAFNDDTLSEENWQRANKLGILPFIESVLQLKYYFGILAEGFKKGFKSFFETLGKISQKFVDLNIDVFGICNAIAEMSKGFAGVGKEDNWEKLGEALGVIAGGLLVVIPLIKALGFAIKVLTPLFKGIKSIVTFVSSGALVTKLGALFAKLSTWGSAIATFFKVSLLPALKSIGIAVSGAVTALAGVLELPVGVTVAIIVAIAAAIAAAVAAIITFWDEISAFFKKVGIAIKTTFFAIVEKIKMSWVNLITAIVNSPVTKFIVTVAKGIAKVFVSAFKLVVTVVKTVAKIIGAVLRALYYIIRFVVYSVAGAFKKAFTKVKEFLSLFVAWISEKFYWLKDNVFTPVAEFFKGIWNSALEYVEPLIITFGIIFTRIGENIKEAFGKVRDFFVGIFETITETARGFFDWVSEKLTKISDALYNFGGNLYDATMSVGDWFKAKGDEAKSMVGLSTGGYVKTTGIAVLHPNEVVVNDQLTKSLGMFLDDYNERPVSTIPQHRQTGSPKLPTIPNKPNPKNPATSGNSIQNDNRVTFSAGSVVIQLANASDTELEKAADKLLKIIERKLQLKKMAIRT